MLERSSPWLAGLALFLAAASATAAQTVPSPYRFIEPGQEAGLFAGFHNPGRGRFDLNPGGGVLFGARYAIEATGPLAVEGVGSYMRGTRRVVDPTLPESQWVIGEAPEEIFFLDLRLRMSITGRRTWHGFTPHLLAGIGVAIGTRTAGLFDAQLRPQDRFSFGNKFTPLVGGGMRYYIGESWMLRADGVLNLYRIDTPDAFLDADLGLEGAPEREWIGEKGLSMGLSYIF
jgi:opacity protein-like surface antigen